MVIGDDAMTTDAKLLTPERLERLLDVQNYGLLESGQVAELFGHIAALTNRLSAYHQNMSALELFVTGQKPIESIRRDTNERFIAEKFAALTTRVEASERVEADIETLLAQPTEIGITRLDTGQYDVWPIKSEHGFLRDTLAAALSAAVDAMKGEPR